MAKVPSGSARERFDLAAEHLSERRVLEALPFLDEAEALGYNIDQCCSSRWVCWMLLGDFEKAWRESDRIADSRARGAEDLWDGKPFDGKRVVIRCLHGFGDAIQFLRYAALVTQSAASLIVETHPEMMSLLERVDGISRVATWGPAGPSVRREDWDQQIEVTQLPFAFRTSLHTVPVRIPYIRIEKWARECSRSRLRLHEHRQSKPRVGLVWASSAWNSARSIALRQLLSAFEGQDFSLFSFQRGPERSQLIGLPGFYQIHDTSLQSPEIVDTAADLLNIDLLVTVDTMAAHLAGALGVPVWMLVPFEADWRWLLETEVSPWYPTMRLFRQPSPGDWSAPVSRISSELAQWIEMQKAPRN